MHAVAIARGHVFNDGNKRTGLMSALAYLEAAGVDLERSAYLEEVMVEIAQGLLDETDFARHSPVGLSRS